MSAITEALGLDLAELIDRANETRKSPRRQMPTRAQSARNTGRAWRDSNPQPSDPRFDVSRFAWFRDNNDTTGPSGDDEGSQGAVILPFRRPARRAGEGGPSQSHDVVPAAVGRATN